MNNRTIAIMSQMMQPNQANVAGNVHGGEIMKFMDNVAGVTAGKYARSNVVTARVDEVQFILPVFVGAIVTGIGKIVYVGTSSIEVMVTVEVEYLETEREPQLALTAFFTMVALDRTGRPLPVKPLVPETAEEKELYEIAARKHEDIKKKKKEA